MAISLNVTNTTELKCDYDIIYPSMQAALRVFGNVPLIVFGSVFNVVSAFVFTRQQMRKSMVNWFLLALTVSDQMVLISNFFMIPLPVIMERTQTLSAMQLADWLTRWMFPIGHFAHCCSVYHLVTVACYRYAGLCYPFKARMWLTTRTVKTAIGLSVLFSAVFTLPRWFELGMIPCVSPTFGGQMSAILQPSAVRNHGYFVIYTAVLYIFIAFVIPFSVLIATSLLILMSLRQSQASLRRKRSSTISHSPSPFPPKTSACPATPTLHQLEYLLPPRRATNGCVNSGGSNFSISLWSRRGTDDRSAVDRPSTYSEIGGSNSSLAIPRSTSPIRATPLLRVLAQERARSTSSSLHRCGTKRQTGAGARPTSGITGKLLAVVAVFVLCNTLPFINNILEIIIKFSEPDAPIISRHSFMVFAEVGSVLVTFNSSINFLIYLIFSSRFREQLKRCCTRKQPRLTTTRGG